MSEDIKKAYEDATGVTPGSDDARARLGDLQRELKSSLPTEPSGNVWDAIDFVQTQMYRVADEHGWHQEPKKTVVEQIALWHSECSEALEEVRSGRALNMTWFDVHWDKINETPITEIESNGIFDVLQKLNNINASIANPEAGYGEEDIPAEQEMEKLVSLGLAKPEGYGIEAADVVIRIMDSLEEQNISLGHMIRLKNMYNETRSYRHGGKTI